METTQLDPEPKPTRKEEPEFDLYTIPSYSSWFAWDNIHETERTALKEFFDGSSITRTPKIYKEYRDFIINKYREDPSRRLTYTDIRKSLVGDVTLLNKVFRFLDSCGLINFGADSSAARRRNDSESEEEEETANFRVVDGPPNGIRVVAMPNSLKPLSLPQNTAVVENALKLPPLTSHSDVFSEFRKQKRIVCGNCGENCNSGRYAYTKGDYILCTKCFSNGSYGENKCRDDFKLNENVVTVWSEAEALLLLESVLKHGDNWDLVVQDVRAKSKLDCISKLIELPFGDSIFSSRCPQYANSSGLSGSGNKVKQDTLSLSEQPNNVVENNEGVLGEQKIVSEQNGDAADEGPPLKRKRIAPLSDAGSSLMKQVAVISTIAGPDVASAATEAAFAALCNETSCPREIFGKEDFPTKGLWPHTLHSKQERTDKIEDTEAKEMLTKSETEETCLGQDDIPLTLQLRTGIATALGAAAAHAKLLADEEDREIENLVTTILETQLKKLQYKIKHFDNLELIMEKEYAELEGLKESFIEERIDVVKRIITAGISKWRDHSFARPQSGSVF